MGRRVLIVEDNPANLALVEYLLRAFGHTPISATTAEEGVRLAAGDHPDVVLMDLHLPGMSGFEALTKLRQMPGFTQVPIIALTASAMMGDRDEILAHGFDGYIAKPITPDTFVAQLEAFIARADNQRPRDD